MKMSLKRTLVGTLLAVTITGCTIHDTITQPTPRLELENISSRSQLLELLSTPHRIIPYKDTIVINPGHSKKYPGTHRFGVKEEEAMLILSRHLKRDLEEKNYKVYMTRDDNNSPNKKLLDLNNDRRVNLADDIIARKQFIEKINPAYVITLHANSYKHSYIKGMEIYYFGVSGKRYKNGWTKSSYLNNKKKDVFLPHSTNLNSEPSKTLALNMQQHIQERTGNKVRVRGTDLAILNYKFNDSININRSSLYIEVGYITNRNDNKKIKEQPEEIAKDISSFFK